MTMPPLPNQGNKNWTTWGQAVHDAATEVVAGRLTEAELRAAFAPTDSAISSDPRWGAVADDATDDLPALQAAADSLATTGGTLFIARRHAVNGTLRVPPKVSVVGHNPTSSNLRQLANDVPTVASKGYLDGSAPTVGRARFRGFGITGPGVATGLSGHGLVVRDYYSEVADVTVSNVGGHGIYMTHLSTGGVSVSGTLVENRVDACSVFSCGGDAYRLGEDDNNKITDGTASRLISSNPGGTHLRIGSSAGWHVSDIHTYGTTPGAAIRLRDAYNTIADRLYIEGFTTYAVYCPAAQANLQISHLNTNAPATATQVVRVEKSSAVAQVAVSVNDLLVRHYNADVTIYAVGVGGGGINVRLSGLRATGAFAPRVLPITGGSLVESDRYLNVGSRWIVGANPAPVSHRAGFTLNGAKTARFPINGVGTFTTFAGLLTITGIKNYNEGVTSQARWVGHVTVGSKDTVNQWAAYAFDVVAPTGFDVAPAVSGVRYNPQGTFATLTAYNPGDTVERDGIVYVNLTAVADTNTVAPTAGNTWAVLPNRGQAADGGLLVVTYTPTAADGYGAVNLIAV